MNTTVLENNNVAIKLYKKFGFKEEGKLKEQLLRDGEYIDVLLMRMTQEDWKKVNKDKI
jgi:RimJ/RimL family protein N-acetyltransferase